jgi:methyl-accepting chemotaxis protein
MNPALSIHAKIFSIVGIFTVGFAIYIAAIVRSTKSALDESDYREVIAMKDLVADVLPPPMYVIESYLLALELERERDPQQIAELRKRWQKLQADYGDRRAYWTEHLEPGSLRSAFLDDSRRSAQRLFELGDHELLPALQAGDTARASAAISAIRAVYNEHRGHIDKVVTLADQRGKDAALAASNAIDTRTQWRVVLGALIALIGGFAAGLIGRDITRRVKRMAEMLARIAAGDMTQRVPVTSGDELGRMAGALNQALEEVETAFLEVKRVASTLARSGAQMAGNIERISSGAQSQAASLEETAASLEQITATVKQSAGNAQQASRVASGSRDVAERGGNVVADAIAAMEQISQCSRRIGDIITTIDEIALQTNLLALNAAVEAARAGEQGRGFAVVAAEVGNLAQRSAAAAKEVKALIQDTLQRVEVGHELVGGSGRSLEEIIASVKKVTEIVAEIASAAREQSLGVDQVNQAVSQVDQVTQSNAAQTQELTRTAEGLSSSATQLRELMSHFTLRDSHDAEQDGTDADAAPPPEPVASGYARPRQLARKPRPAASDADFEVH